MPLTKSAKRAQRSSKRKRAVNKKIVTSVEVAIKKAHRNKSKENILAAISLVDRARKKALVHKNKAARMKSKLSKLLPKKS